MFHDNEGDGKFEEKLAPGSKKDMGNLFNFHPTTQKSKTFA